MLKMIVIPIIFFSLVHGAASLPLKTFGKMGLWVCAWYFFTSLFAAVFGSGVALVFDPTLSSAAEVAGTLVSQAEAMKGGSVSNAFVNIVLGMFTNPFKALAEGNFLAVIVFAIAFGLAARVVMDSAKEERTRQLISQMLDMIEAMQLTVFKMIDWVMAYFPIGIFALTSCSFAVYGISLFQSYLQVAACVIVGIILMIFVCYPAIIAIICKVNPFPILWKLREPVLTAFVTRSSAATLPVSMRTAEEKLHVKKELSGFTLSLGATINMTGNAIYYTLVAIFFAQFYGIDLTMTHYVAIAVTASLGSIGQAGVPGPTLMVVAVLISAGIPIDGLPLLYALDRVFDMIRTVLNITGGAACAAASNSLAGCCNCSSNSA